MLKLYGLCAYVLLCASAVYMAHDLEAVGVVHNLMRSAWFLNVLFGAAVVGSFFVFVILGALEPVHEEQAQEYIAAYPTFRSISSVIAVGSLVTTVLLMTATPEKHTTATIAIHFVASAFYAALHARWTSEYKRIVARQISGNK